MKTKFTQGKWQIGKTAGLHQNAIWVGGSRIAVIDEFPHEGSEHNAKLIVCAPELLESLQNCLSALIAFGANDEWTQVIQANNIIDKALGI